MARLRQRFWRICSRCKFAVAFSLIFARPFRLEALLDMCLGGLIGNHLGWRWAFYLVTPPGLLLGVICFFMRDPRERFQVRRQS